MITNQTDLVAALLANPNADVEINAAAEINLSIETGRPILRLFGATKLRLSARESSQPHVEARESSQPHVEAWGSSQPHVEAWESSQPHVVARGSSQPHVVARGSSQPHVVARESSQPHVEACGSSQPHVEAWGSSQPHVVARGSSQPHVEAWGFAQLSLTGKGIVAKASAKVAVLLRGGAKAKGGMQTTVRIKTAAEWCEYYGVEVKKGVALLYKALNADFHSPRGALYGPGEIPIAPDWDGGKAECGGGLHFSPSAGMALEFHPEAKKFAACPVRLSDISVHPDGMYPQKVKARGCCAPCFEVDRRGVPVGDAPDWSAIPKAKAAPKKSSAKAGA